jgi:hypothetical protein
MTDNWGNYTFSSENIAPTASYASRLLIIPQQEYKIRILPENFGIQGNLSHSQWTPTIVSKTGTQSSDSNITFQGNWSENLYKNYQNNGIYTPLFRAPSIITKSDTTIDI